MMNAAAVDENLLHLCLIVKENERRVGGVVNELIRL